MEVFCFTVSLEQELAQMGRNYLSKVIQLKMTLYVMIITVITIILDFVTSSH